MKKVSNFLLRIVCAILVCISGFLLLKSPINIVVKNVPAMAKAVVQKNVDHSDNVDLKNTLKLGEELGVTDKIWGQLQHKYHYDLSYTNLYNLSVSYQENGELTNKNLNLTQKNQVQQVFNYVILDRINHNLKRNSQSIKQKIKIFQYFFLGVIALFAITTVLVLLGKKIASLLLLLLATATFGLQQFYVNELLQYLQTELYHGITLSTSAALWLGWGLALVVAVIWWLILKITAKNN
jgi:hypothetical protein